MTPSVLTIAGSDPSGAAGIQVDLQVFRDHGVHGLSVLTAVIAQNTRGVQRLEPVDADMLRAQLRCISSDVEPWGIKIGLLVDRSQVDVVTDFIAEYVHVPVVWDPVLRSGDGKTALSDDDTRAGILQALPLVDVFTPNVPELEALLDVSIATRDQAHEAAATLCGRYDETGMLGVLLKAGHLDDGTTTVQDIWADASGVVDLPGTVRIGDDVRGTGCQLSSAIAARLADVNVDDPRGAVEGARQYLSEMLNKRQMIGGGRPVVVRS